MTIVIGMKTQEGGILVADMLVDMFGFQPRKTHKIQSFSSFGLYIGSAGTLPDARNSCYNLGYQLTRGSQFLEHFFGSLSSWGQEDVYSYLRLRCHRSTSSVGLRKNGHVELFSLVDGRVKTGDNFYVIGSGSSLVKDSIGEKLSGGPVSREESIGVVCDAMNDCYRYGSSSGGYRGFSCVEIIGRKKHFAYNPLTTNLTPGVISENRMPCLPPAFRNM